MTEHKLLYLEQGRKITSFNSICNGTYDSLQSFLKVCGILQLAVPYLNITALLRRQMSLQANVVNSTMGCRADGCNEHLEMRSCYSDMSPLTQLRQSRMTVPSACWGSNKWRHLNVSTCLEASSVPFWSSSVKFFKIPAGFTLTCKEIYLLCFQAHKYLTALWEALSPAITYSSKKICENNSLQAVPMTQRLWLSGCSLYYMEMHRCLCGLKTLKVHYVIQGKVFWVPSEFLSNFKSRERLSPWDLSAISKITCK